MPFLGLIISFVGAFAISALAIVFPAIADLCVNWEDGKGSKWVLFKDVLIMLFGAVGLIAGTYVSIYEIVLEYRSKHFAHVELNDL